jgi:hypothetical protein
LILGEYTFAWKPDDFTPPDPELYKSVVRTWDTAVYFSWGPEILGKPIELKWIWMSEAQWDELDALYQAKAPVIWDLEEPGIGPFTVVIPRLEGELFEVAGYEQPYRKDVKMGLVITDTLLVADFS